MANPEHVFKLLEGLGAWNDWRRQHNDICPDLSAIDLSGRDLGMTNLMLADLTGTHLMGASMFGSRLVGTTLRNTTLTDADLTEASMLTTVLADLDLRSVKGLERVTHLGPSSIDIDTIYKSKGEIPDVFLRGCGVPEEMIGFIHSIRGAIQFYSCFISYSTKDEEFAKRIHADLQAAGVRCWYAPHDMRAGLHLHDQIDQAIRIHNKDLLILSPNSIESAWVKTETIKARNREIQENTRVLFPVRLCDFGALENWRCVDTSTDIDHAHEVRKFFIPDFSDWTNPASYKAALEKLLRDLKPSA